MRIALAALPVTNHNRLQNVQTILQTLHDQAGKADLILFGESFLSGFDTLSGDYEQDLAMAVTPSHPVILQICQAARQAQTAVSFGCIEKDAGVLYSAQYVIGAQGELIHTFRRISPGWKTVWNDPRYQEGDRFGTFDYLGKRMAIALCGDLWTEGQPQAMRSLHPDCVLWPVWCDYQPDEWNTQVKHEYAQQAALCGCPVLMANPFCIDPDAEDRATGGAAFFTHSKIAAELPAGAPGILQVDI